MPTRRNDALDAHLNAYFQIASAGVNRNGTMLTEAALAQLRDMLYTVQPIIAPPVCSTPRLSRLKLRQRNRKKKRESKATRSWITSSKNLH